MDLEQAMQVAAAGMKVQGARMRMVAQNLANAEFDRARARAASPIGARPSPSRTRSIASSASSWSGSRAPASTARRSRCATSPGHPAADADGYVLMPNVNPLLEMMDLREAQRSFEANLNALTLARSMVQRTLDLLR